LIREARRRRVFRVAGLYIVAAWVVVQVALAAFPALSISDAAVRYVWLAALLGFPVVMFFGWRYDIRDGRIVKTGADDADAPLALQQADFVVLAAMGIVAVMILAGSLREITSMEPSEPLWPSRNDIDSASVAVLPFVNMSDDPGNEYFSDGLTETLLHMLAQLPDLKVSARTSAFSFKNKNVDIRTIALALGVAHVLEGSVQKAGNRVRVTAQLIRADDGFHVWSQNYDRDLNDIFAIQDEISGDVAVALGSALLGEDDAGIRNVETENFAAYDIYLRALEQQNINTKEALLNANQFFNAALEKDPGFVDAKLGLARNYIWQNWKSAIRLSDTEEYRTAQTLVREVLAQRPENLSAQVMDRLLQLYIGHSQNPNFGPDESLEPVVDEMVRLAKRGHIDSFLTGELVFLISGPVRGRNEEALELLLSALETDPLNIDLLRAQFRFFRDTDRLEEAKQPLLTALKVAPENPEFYKYLAQLARSQENFVESQDWYRQAHLADPEDPGIPTSIARTFYQFGLLSEGDRWFDRVRAMAPNRDDLIFNIEIEAAAAAQDRDRLIEVLEEGIAFTIAAEGYNFLSTVYYPGVMSAQGRSQEALDFLTGLIPELQDYSKLVGTNLYVQFMQGQTFLLQQDVMDQESYERLAEGFAKVLETQYPWLADMTDPRSRTIYKVFFRTMLGEHDQALELLLEGHANWPVLSEGWRLLQVYPWFERYRNDPELALAISQYEKKKARIADELREMVKRPEWRH
jgi:TolB-like protein